MGLLCTLNRIAEDSVLLNDLVVRKRKCHRGSRMAAGMSRLPVKLEPTRNVYLQR